jgi:hypothetical protein
MLEVPYFVSSTPAADDENAVSPRQGLGTDPVGELPTLSPIEAASLLEESSLVNKNLRNVRKKLSGRSSRLTKSVKLAFYIGMI